MHANTKNSSKKICKGQKHSPNSNKHEARVFSYANQNPLRGSQSTYHRKGKVSNDDDEHKKNSRKQTLKNPEHKQVKRTETTTKNQRYTKTQKLD